MKSRPTARLNAACAALGLLTLASPLTHAVSPEQKAAEMKFFETKIRPLLAESCLDCHGPEKDKGGLRLDHLSWILQGGDTGPAIVAGDPEASLLMEVVRRDDPDFAMPPKEGDALSAEQVEDLRQWIAQGAPWPEGGHGDTAAARDENGFTEEDRKWWAVQPVTDPTPPAVDSDWPKNAIDRFILAKLQEKDLEPAPEASPEELIRRATFDLHGLPPTPEAIDAFVTAHAEDADKAIAELVDELLASPRYGEQWAQHWLDVVRYAESDGYRADDYRPGTWKYRDYVIRSLNEDKPYDQFVREQLAADEFAAHDPETLIGTAFLRLGIYEWNQRNARMQWDLIMTEMTNVTAEAFLGVGIGCAQCHDHKFDPILQKDHYALRAFLSTTWWPENQPLGTPEELAEHDRKQAEWEKATAEIREKMAELTRYKIESDTRFTVGQFPEDIQAIYHKPQAERTAYEEQLAQLVQRQVDNKIRKIDFRKELAKKKDGRLEKYVALHEALAAFDSLKPKPLPMGFVSTDIKPDPALTVIEKRKEDVEVDPAFLTLLGQPAPEIESDGRTTGRRKALAEWIASPDNPLSTRVITNRLWQHHFGQGIVATPNDFGTLGEPPSHPELLDWLTQRFLEGDWQLKALHRLIMTSATYRQTARVEPGEHESIIDPENRFLWRYPPRRLGAEQIRDAMLSLSGELREGAGKPSVDGGTPHRSVYVKKRRNTPDPVLAAFDAPSGFDSAPTRLETTTPTQSLLMLNADWPLKRARGFASRLLQGSREVTAKQITEAYRMAWGRQPTELEIQSGLDFVRSQTKALGQVSEAKPAPDKFPNETGLRPIKQHFKPALSAELPLGDRALWLQPGSRFEQLDLGDKTFVDDQFTVEAVVQLDGLHKDASVNTLVSRWNGNQGESGWTFGVTSEKSRYQPRNVIMQLIGENAGADVVYEVVASDLRMPLGKPVYLAASVKTHPEGRGHVTFYLKDLSDPESPLQTAKVPHSIATKLQRPDVPLLIGGRHQPGHLWDGQVAALNLLRDSLTQEQLPLLGRKAAAEQAAYGLTFSGDDGAEPVTQSKWVRRSTPQKAPGANPYHGALTDFCHALLNSNEFLYLH